MSKKRSGACVVTADVAGGMARLPKTSTLMAIAGGLGLGLGMATMLLDKERHKWVNRHPQFVAKALEMIDQNPEVKALFGDKMEVGKITLNDGWARMTAEHVQLKVPIQGERDNAYLYAYARKRGPESSFGLYKLEATFSKIENKKLIIFDRTDEPDVEPEAKDTETTPRSSESSGNDQSHPPASQRDGVREKKTRKMLDIEEMKSWR